MHLIRHLKQQIQKPSVVVIGNFDGVHNGHKKMVSDAVSMAKHHGCSSVVMTFRPYPFQLFSKQGVPSAMLSKLTDQYKALKPLGVDILYAQKFSEKTASMTPVDFVEKILVGKLNAKHVIVGEDFHFGAKRTGNTETLVALGAVHGFDVHIQEDIPCDGGERFSSSRTRAALAEGDVMHAKELLGHFWTVRAHLQENDYCDLVADLSAYTAIKDGGYWVKAQFTNGESQAETSSIIPVFVKQQKLYIKPLETLPDIPNSTMASITFYEPLHEL